MSMRFQNRHISLAIVLAAALSAYGFYRNFAHAGPAKPINP